MTSLVGGDRPAGGTSPTVRNVNNAARNLVEIIANEARNDTSGAYRIRIYTLGLGTLLTLPAGRLEWNAVTIFSSELRTIPVRRISILRNNRVNTSLLAMQPS